MNNVTNTMSNVHSVVETNAAANADQIGEAFGGTTTVVGATETSTGWDSYEVWRRFIKDARDRRRSGT